METVDIIETIVDALTLTFKVDSVVDNGDDTYTIYTCNTLHLQVGYPVTINNVEYEILSIVRGVSITVSGSALPPTADFTIAAPLYFHGTVIKAQEDMLTIGDSDNVFNRTPFIYLKEIISDKKYASGSVSPLDRETTLRMFFLTMSDFANWKTAEHYEMSITPMRNLIENFIDKLEKSPLIGKFEDYETTNHVNFGVYVDAKGHTGSVFVDHLSGIELNITLPFYKQNRTTNCNTDSCYVN